MDTNENWLRYRINILKAHPYEVHLAAFICMLVPPVLLYLATANGSTTQVIILLSVVIIGNILVLLVR